MTAPPGRFDRRWLWAIPALFAASYGAGEVLTATRTARLPKNVVVVRPGVLIRAGQLRPDQLETLAVRHGLKTVVCLNPGEVPDEAARMAALGVRHVELAMPGDGMGAPSLFHEFLRIVAKPDRGPVLVHCAAGAMRTGVATAAYRVVFEGWSEADAAGELVYHGCPIHRVPALAARLRETLADLPPDLQALRTRGPAPVPALAEAEVPKGSRPTKPASIGGGRFPARSSPR